MIRDSSENGVSLFAGFSPHCWSMYSHKALFSSVVSVNAEGEEVGMFLTSRFEVRCFEPFPVNPLDGVVDGLDGAEGEGSLLGEG